MAEAELSGAQVVVAVVRMAPQLLLCITIRQPHHAHHMCSYELVVSAYVCVFYDIPEVPVLRCGHC